MMARHPMTKESAMTTRIAAALLAVAASAAAEPLAPDQVSYDYRATHEIFDEAGKMRARQVVAGSVVVTEQMRARESEVIAHTTDTGRPGPSGKQVGIDTEDAFYLLVAPDGEVNRHARPAGGFAESDAAATHAAHTAPDPIRFAYTAGLWNGGTAGRHYEIGADLAEGESTVTDPRTGWQVRTGTDTKAGRPRVLWVLASTPEGEVVSRATVTYLPYQPLLPATAVHEMFARGTDGKPTVVSRSAYTFSAYRMEERAAAATPEEHVYEYLLPRVGAKAESASVFFIDGDSQGGPRIGKLKELLGEQ